MSKRRTGTDFKSVSEENSSSEADVSKENDEEYFELQKKIGLPGGVAVIAGTMIGSGIFVSPVGVLAGTNGSVGLSLVLWVACGIIAGIVSLCYCELGSSIKESGAEHAYLNVGYGPVVAFAFAWTFCLVTRAASLAAIASTFGNYAVSTFYAGQCDPPNIIVKGIAAVLIMSACIVNCTSVKLASKIQMITTISKFVAMLVIIIGGLVRLGQGDPVGQENFSNAFRPEDLAGITFTQIGLAMYQGLFPYDGWRNLNIISEEVKDSAKNVPRAVFITVPLVTIFYVLVNISYFSVLLPAEILTSGAVAVTWSYRVFGDAGWIMIVFVCLSTAGAVNGGFLSSGRMPFVASRRGHLPMILSMVNVNYLTPVPSLIFMCALGIAYTIPNDFSSLVNAFSFTSWLFYGMVSLSVLILRYTHPDMPRPYKVPLILPVLAVVISLYLVIAPLVDDPELIILFALGFVLLGPVVYFIFVYKKLYIPGMDYVTAVLQQVLNVAPTNEKDLDIGKESKK